MGNEGFVQIQAADPVVMGIKSYLYALYILEYMYIGTNQRTVILAELGIVVYTITHMIGMTSTITNPILYAFLNENFTKEFR